MAERMNRRQFLKILGLTGAALAVGALTDTPLANVSGRVLDCGVVRRVLSTRNGPESIGKLLDCYQGEVNGLSETWGFSNGRVSIVNNDRAKYLMALDRGPLDYWIKRSGVADVPVSARVVMEGNNHQKTALLASTGNELLMSVSGAEIERQYQDLTKNEFGVRLPEVNSARIGYLNLEANRLLIQGLILMPRLYYAARSKGGLRSDAEESRLTREANVEVKLLTQDLLADRLPRVLTVVPRMNDGKAVTV